MTSYDANLNLLELVEDLLEHFGDAEEEGVYVISVAARLAEMHPNTLRKYERAGILTPERTSGRQRLYSEENIDVLRLVRVLNSKYGLSVQGINLMMELINLIRSILRYLEQVPSLQNDSAARELAALIRKQLKQL